MPFVVEEVFEGLVEVDEELRVIDDARVVHVAEAHLDPRAKRHQCALVALVRRVRVICGSPSWRRGARPPRRSPPLADLDVDGAQAAALGPLEALLSSLSPRPFLR